MNNAQVLCLIDSFAFELAPDVTRFQEDEESYSPKEAADLRPKVEQLKAEYDELIELARAKSETLKAKQTLHELQQDLSEMDQWIITKLELLKR